MNNQEIDILLVEDNLDDAALAIRALKKHRYADKLMHLTDGEDLLDYLFGRGTHADRPSTATLKVLVLDLKMPRVNGFEALKVIKTDPLTKYIPVVILTSSSQETDIAKAYELGANSYIVKPVEFDMFTETMVELGSYWLTRNKEKH